MNRILQFSLLVFLLIASTNLFAQLQTWELSAAPGNQASSIATTAAANTASGILQRGAGVTAAAAGGCISSSGWFNSAVATTLAQAISNNEYYEFTLPINTCNTATISSVSVVVRSSNTGPNTATLRSSADGFTADLGTISITAASVLNTINTPSLTNLSGTITFRLYGYGGAAGGGTPATAGTFRIGTSVTAADNDLFINGSTTNNGPSTAVISGNGTFCFEGNTGNAPMVVNVTGGTGPFTVVVTEGTNNYTQNSYVSGNDISIGFGGIGNFTFTLVSVADANGCTVPSNALTGASVFTSSCTSGPGITLTETNGSTDVSESGIKDTFSLVLNEAPTDSVYIPISPDAQSMVSPIYVTFLTSNWNVPQNVIVMAIDDSIIEGPHTSTIALTVTSSDPNYNTTLPNVIANVTDNDINPTVVLNCPANTTVAACQSQTAITAAFNAWKATATGTGGCNGALTNNGNTPPLACGDSTIVTFTYTSTCEPLISTCLSTFKVSKPNTVILNCPTNTTAPTCQTQGHINILFANWLASASASGGCNGSLSNINTGAPSVTGGATTVTFTYTSSCVPFITTCQATYTVPTQQAPANAGPDQSVCFVPVTLGAVGTGIWSGGTGTFSNTTSATATYTPSASEQGTTVNLTWTISTQCGPSADQVAIIFAPNQAIITYPAIACTSGPSLSPILGPGSMNGLYTYTGAGTLSINANSGVINPALSTPGMYTITNTFTPPTGSGPALMLLGVIDAPLTGGIPKAIKLVALSNIPNMAIYGLENTSNGAASAGVPDFVFPSGAVTAGTIIWVASEAVAFNTWFGFAPTYINGVANNNGDDGILLYTSGVITDSYGIAGQVPPTIGSWNYLDGWAHRKSVKCPSVVFNLADWDLSGVDALDDDALNTNATSTPPFPAGSYLATSCAATSSCPSSDTSKITIRLSPMPNTGGGKVICGAIPVTITATGGVGVWSGGSGIFSSTTTATTIYTPNISEIGKQVKLVYKVVDAICGTLADTFRLSILPLPKSAEFSYGANLFCPNGINPTVSHTLGVDGVYSANSPNIKVDSLTGEIKLNQTTIGTYTVTNTVYACGNLMITGIIDGNLPGGQPKAIELYALADIRNLNEYGLGVVNNGGVSAGQEFTFPSIFVKKGSFLYAANNAVDFNSFFGFQPNFTVNQLQINGDDMVEVYCGGQLIDQFGVSNQDGTGTSWEYMDGWAYRKNNANIAGAGFIPSTWNYSGINALDPATTNANAVPPFPVRSFTTTAAPICPPNTFSQTITIDDTTPPTIVCPPTLTVNLGPGFCGDFVQLPLPTVMDNCPGNIIITQTAGPISGSFFTKFDSPYTITYSAKDAIGNGPVTCSFQVLVLEYPFPISSLACNDLVNISLDQNCEVLVGSDMILSGGPYGCYDEYIVSVSGQANNLVTKIGLYTVTVTDPETGNSCWGKIKVEDKLPPIIVCEVPMCDLSELKGEWEISDPVFNPNPTCWTFDGGAPQGNSRYDVIEFTVVTPGSYTFTMTNNTTYDGIAAIYGGSFNPANNCLNLLAGDDDITGVFESEPQFTAMLSAGKHFLVSTTWASNQLGVYEWTFTGPGTLQTPCPFKCYDISAIQSGAIKIAVPKIIECSDYTVSTTTKLIGNECEGQNMIYSYIVTDAFGNTSSCTQNIKIEQLEIKDITLPPSVVVMNSCGAGITPSDVSAYFDIDSRSGTGIGGYNDDYTEAQGSPAGVVELNEGYAIGYPHYFAVGRDGNLHAQKIDNNVCSIYATYTDQVLSACGAGCIGNSKVIRTWTLLDWCTIEQATYVQVIKAVDLKAPTFIVKDVTVGVSPWGCVANFDVPAPWELADNCDAHPKWWIEGPAGVVITGNPIDGYKVTGAPKGVHNFIYKAIDCCGNIGTAVAVFTVIDRAAPVAVAKQNIVISLTGSGTGSDGAAKLFTGSVDNGSYDFCSDIKLELRRPDGSPDCGNLGIEDHNNNVTFDDDENFSPGASWKHPEDDKDDTDDGKFVKFCCVDLAGGESTVHQVIMRVWDDGNMNGIIGDNLIIDGMQDNYNETWVDVRVENKLAPVIVCPKDATVTCDMELNISTVWRDVTEVVLVTGEAEAFDLCIGIKVEYKDTPTWTNTCENVGRIRREFRAIKGTKTVNCFQTITVGAIQSTFVVTPPSNSVLDAPCDFDKSKIKASDKPKVLSGACDVIGEEITIDEYLFEDGVCKKWRVNYNYINWCTGEQKGPFVKYYKYKDEVKPVLTCADQMFAANPNPQNPLGGCEGTVNLEASATDEGGCIAGGWLKWTVIVDLWGNGTNDYEFSSFLPTTDNNLGNDTNGNGIPDRYVAPTSDGQLVKVPAFVLDAEMSTHKVFWKVTDGCGNVTSCNSTFMVVDKKAPTPYCVSLSSALMTNCQVELWAIDFNKGSFDNCTAQNDLLYTFDGEMPVWLKLGVEHYFKGAGLDATAAEYNAGNAQRWVPSYGSSAKIFNKAGVIEVNMNVWDGKLNTDFCKVTLTLIDNTGGCGTTSESCDCNPNQYTGMAVITCNALPGTNNPVAAIMDVRKNSQAPRGSDWADEITIIRPKNWTIDSIGQVFSIAIDNKTSNIFLATSDVYDRQFNQDLYGSGQIFIARPPQFRAVPFVSLFNTGGNLNAIGGIIWDKMNDQLIASNLEDGKLYRISNAGVVLETYDPWLIDDQEFGLTTDSEQVWGLGYNKENNRSKVYFARIGNSERTIYSLTLDVDGTFPAKGSEIKEVTNVPGVGLRITDIEFSQDGNKMLVAERGTYFTTGAHDSQVMRYNKVGNAWSFGLKYQVGANVQDVYPNVPIQAPGETAAGGVDFGYGESGGVVNKNCNALVWSSANWMRTPDGNLYYGLQGMNVNGNNIYNHPTAPNMKTDIILDFDGDYTSFNDKGSLGDVEIFRCDGSTSSSLVEIDGKIIDMLSKPIANVNVAITGSLPEYPKFKMSNGNFDFDVMSNNTYTISPTKTDDYNNGVSTLDLVIIQRHILGITKLTSPEKLIAADVNNDEKITASDLVELRKLILGMLPKLAKNDSWTFIPKSYVYPEPAKPYNAPRFMTLNVLDDINDADFHGIKIGDVNLDAVAATGKSSDNRTSNSLKLEAEDKEVKAGEVVTINVTSANFAEIFGYQFTAKLTGAEVLEVKSGAINVENTYGMPTSNTMTMSYASDKAVSATAGEVLFTIVLKATTNGRISNMMNVGSDVTRAESYVGAEMTTTKLEMNFRTNGEAVEGYTLYQNEPNPFTSTTVVSFNMPTAAKTTITLTDVTGKVVNIKNIEAVKGMNKVEYNRNDVPMSGVVYYTVSSGDFTATKAMIVIE